MTAAATVRRAFRDMHREGCFVLPNPWDVGSARRFARLGARALASTSAGAAWAMGRDDGQLTRDEVVAHLALLVGATDLPVNADFEAGFGDTPAAVAESVAAAVATGIAGLSIEDRDGGALYPVDAAVERIAAARGACGDALLVARCESYLLGIPDVDATVARLRAYAAAGADCVYAPAMTDLGEIARLVAAVAPLPVNVLLWGDLTVEALARIGVRRVSTGAALAGAAYGAAEAQAARLLAQVQ
jgi:2-methylisocitrate lyase-like PEP mutase family enzyme